MPETTLNLDRINLADLTPAVDEDDQVLPPDQVALPATMNEAFKVNPAQHAQDLKLSERADIPVSAVTGANKEIEAGLKLNQIDFTEMSQRSPVTSKFLTDYDNAVVAQNDISLLERIEKTFAGAGRSAVLGFKTQLEGAKLAVLESNYLKNYLDATFKPGSQIKAAIHDVKDDTAESIVGEIKTLQEKRADLTPEDLNLVEQGLRAGLESLINMAPGFAASLITRSPTPMLSAMTVQTTASSFGEARAEGLSSDDAVRKGQIDGAIEGLSELIPAKTLIKLLGGGVGSSFKKGAIKFAAQEIGTEYIAEIGQSLNAYAFGLDKELENAEGPAEIAEIMLRRLAVVTVATMFAGGAQIGTVATINKTVEVLTRETEQKERKGLNEQEVLNQLNQDAAASELRENSPERFHQFVQDADGANETHVFIDGPALAEYLEGQDVGEDAALILLLDKVNEAAMLGADAAIPVADFATVIAGTPHFEALVNHMTLSEETNSPARQDQAKAETQKYIETLVAEAQENVSQYVEAQEIYESVREQLIDSGQVAPEHADTMAKLVPAWATVYAQKNGLTIQEVYDQSGLTIEGPQTGEAARLENEASLLQEAIDPQDSYDDPRNEGRGDLALTVRQLDIEEEFQAELDADYEGAIERYRKIPDSNGGQIIGGDIFKELSDKYLADRTLAGAVHGPSSALAVTFFENSLKEDVPENRVATVRFLAGGTGAGKTTAINKAKEDAAKEGNEEGDPQIIMDGNLAHMPSTFEKIEQSLDAGKTVEVIMVYREMMDAFKGTLERAAKMEKKEGSGRTVPLIAHFHSHRNSIEVVQAVAEKYKTHPWVEVTVIDNTHGFGNAVKSDLDMLDNVVHNVGEQELLAELEDQYEKGKISETIYKGFKGSSSVRDTGAEGRSKGEESGRDSESIEQGDDGVQEGGRQEKLAQASARGYYDPVNTTIRLTESADLSTFLHEFAHFMLEMERGAGGETLTSINNWFKRNAESVAAEANQYLDDDAVEDLQQSAFHGTQTLFDKFRTSFLGEGIGGQNFGWGLYFSGQRKIAEHYRDKISNPGGNIVPDNKGNVYEVDIPEDSELLDYDKPLSEQSDHVKNALKSHLDGSEVFLSANGPISNPTGRQIYENILKGVDILDGRNTESVSKLLNELGIPGLRYSDKTRRGFEANNTHNYVMWDESQIQIEGINDEQISDVFNKSEDTAPLEQTGDIPAGSTGAVTAADVVQYIDQGSTGDTAKDAALRKAIHEQFARGFETYLMEGKAPSVELRNVFRTFARWLVEVYRRVKGDLKVDLDAEMRQVFDMMLATEEQIAAADARAQTAPMFTDAAMAGMTEDQWQTYLKQQSKSKDKAAETLRDKLIAQITRQTKSWWKEEKADLVVEETERLKDEPVYRAISTLRDTDLKMDHATAMDMFGEDRVDKRGKKSRHIPGKLRKMTVKGGAGVHPDEAAALLGYGSGAEMIADITESPTLKEAAEESSEAIMLERHGDILNDGTIQQQADEAVQNEERGKLILQELKVLAKGTKIPTLDRMTIKAMAEENIARLSFRQIQPGKYRKAELRAAQEAAVALAKGDKQAATAAKTRQVLNFYLGMAATEARNGTMKIVDRMARYNKKKVREQILKAENGYWEQIVKILQRFEFRKAATLKSVDQTNESLTAWMNERNEVDGAALMITPEVLNELYTSHWKNVPYGTLQGINDSVKNIEHVARYSNKMTMLQDEIDFKKLINRLVDHINEKLPERFPKAQRTTVVSEKGVTRWAASQMSKLPWLFTELDGGERVGLVHEIMMQPFNDAQFAELGMFDEVLSKIYESIEGRSKEDRARHNSTLFIPEIKDENNDGNLKGHQVLAVALNTGNQGNLKKMLLGEGWANPEDETTITRDNPQLQAVLRHMTKNDWELVQLIWDQMQTLYPQLAEVHRKTSGLTPPQVEATPFTVKVKGSLEEIEMNGGYYPVVYDKERSKKARDIAKRDEANVDSLFSTVGSIQASVTAGATNERTGFYGPIKLSLEVVPNHFQEVIHFITHHDAVRQANMIIRNESFREAVKSRLGEDEFNQLEPWLNDIAKAGKNAPVKTFIDAAFSQLRMGTTLGVMGAKVSTGLIQVLGIWNAVGELGVAKTFEGMKLTISKSHVMRAYRSLLGSESDLQTGMEFALEHSKVMKNRIKTMDREMANVFRELESSVDFKADLKGKKGIGAAVDVASTAGINALKALKKSRILRKLQEVSMMHIALIQMYTVDLPSWHAGYSSGLEQWGDEERATRYADFVVENLQGSGNIKDMAMLMRNQGKIHTSFTMFMTFFSTLWNISRDFGRGVKNKRLPATTIAAKLMFIYMIPTLLEMLLRDELRPDDDEEPIDKLEEYLLKLAMYPVSSVPFVRDIANGATSGYGYTMNPIAGILEKGVEGGSSAIAAAFDEEKDVTMAQVKNATKLAGAALGIPGVGQIWATGEHLYDVLQEGEDLTLHQMGFGPKRE